MSDDVVEVRASPVLPVRELEQALEHYRALGFLTTRHDESYGFASWRGLELHLSVMPDHDPLRTAAAVFLHVPDADAVARAWARVPRTGGPVDTPYRIREGWHIDPDGNLLRFGSPLRSSG